MNWEILIVPMIALGVWILSTVFRGAEEGKDKPRRQGDGATPPRRPASEIDRFLEEARRRRDKVRERPAPEAEREPERTIPAAVLPPTNPPPPPPRPEPRKREPQPTGEMRKREPAPTTSARALNDPLLGRIEDRPSFANPASAQAKPMMALPTNMETPALPTLPTPTMDTPATSSDQNRRDASPLRAALSSMLRDRTALRTAFILHEILDEPLCKRREGRHGGQD